MHPPFVRYAKTGAIVTLQFDRATRRNAIAELGDCEEIVAAVERAQSDSDVSCLVLTGAGPAFCAGGDLRVMKERRGIGRLDSAHATRANYRRGVQRAVMALWNCELPMVAAINGPAIGLGLDLACTCDIRIASEQAVFASSFIKLGLVPGDGGAWILPRIIGLSRASELILSGDSIDAATGLAWGLVSRVVAAERLLDEAQALAQRVAANPAATLRLSKRLLREGQQQRLADVMELSAAFQALAHETADHAEAVDAFLDKRAPRFQGR